MLTITNLSEKETSKLHHHGKIYSVWFPSWIKYLEALGGQTDVEKTTVLYYVNK